MSMTESQIAETLNRTVEGNAIKEMIAEHTDSLDGKTVVGPTNDLPCPGRQLRRRPGRRAAADGQASPGPSAASPTSSPKISPTATPPGAHSSLGTPSTSTCDRPSASPASAREYTRTRLVVQTQHEHEEA